MNPGSGENCYVKNSTHHRNKRADFSAYEFVLFEHVHAWIKAIALLVFLPLSEGFASSQARLFLQWDPKPYTLQWLHFYNREYNLCQEVRRNG